MTDDSLIWPTDKISEAEVREWVRQVCGIDVSRAEILQTKSWGVTARFDSVVFKASFVSLYPQASQVQRVLEQVAPDAVPRLLAVTERGGQLWSTFENVPGQTAEAVGSATVLSDVAKQLARVQRAATMAKLEGIPSFSPYDIPEILADDVSDQPDELSAWLRESISQLKELAATLLFIPFSLDHPDMNWSNAIVRANGSIVLIDWEEATVGCPLFSLDRLLSDARDTGCEAQVADAYQLEYQGITSEMLVNASILAPLKLAIEARAFARGLAWQHPHTKYTTHLLQLARSRYNQASS